MMKELSPTLRSAVFAGAGAMLLLGWTLGGKREEAAHEEVLSRADARLTDRAARPDGKYRTPDHAVSRVAAIRALSSRGEQMRATIALVNSLTLEELAEWIEGRWFDHGGDFNLTLFNKIAEKRWQTEDPDGYLAYQIRQGGGSAYEAMDRLAREDPERLFAYFREHPDASMELSLLQRVANDHPDLALARARELIESGVGLGDSVRHQLGYTLRTIAAKDPALVEGLLESVPTFFAREIERGIVSKGLQDSFSETMRDLWGRADGWSLFSGADLEGKGGKLLAEIHDLPAAWKNMIAQQPHSVIDGENAAQWLGVDFKGAGFTDKQAKDIVSRSLMYLASEDPQETLRQMDKWEISENDRNNLIQRIFGANSVEQTRALLDSLPSDQERAKAAGMLEARMRHETVDQVTAPTTPKEWMETLSGMDEASVYPLVSQLRNWNSEKIAEITAGFHDLPAETKDKLAASLLDYGNSVDPALRGEAVRHQLTSASDESGNPSDDPFRGRNPEERASALAVEWMKSDPGAASQWVNSLPAGDAKLWAQKNLARNWALYDPDSAKLWVSSLPGHAKTEVTQFLKDKE